MPETAKRLDAIVNKIISVAMTLMLGVVSWYLSGINTSIKEINTELTQLNIQYRGLEFKMGAAEKAQMKYEIDNKTVLGRIGAIELKQERTDEILKRHETMINDKRRCISCVEEK